MGLIGVTGSLCGSAHRRRLRGGNGSDRPYGQTSVGAPHGLFVPQYSTLARPRNYQKILDFFSAQKHQKLFGEMTDTKKVPASDAFVGGIKIRPLTQIS